MRTIGVIGGSGLYDIEGLTDQKWVRLDTPFVRDFVADVRERIAGAPTPAAACEAIRPIFAEALSTRDWLPAEFQRAVEDSGMGGGGAAARAGTATPSASSRTRAGARRMACAG